MDFEATDKYMSGWVATCGESLYMTEAGGLSPLLRNAAWRRWGGEVESLVRSLREALPAGVNPEAVPVAEALAREALKKA